ncbi:MAG: ChbG/HpnK family deacetylase [Planctomycetes bacterium]|nr:ChbG/HpnK family deacetylase [Planctomycetota bacterium]
MTRRLLVNADDLGGDPAGIVPALRTLREGIVRRVSLLANGVALETAAALSPGTPTSLHLNLSEGLPLSGPVPGLCGSDGAFPGRAEARRRLESGAAAPDALEREVRAQHDRLVSLGARIDRLDGHQHLHVLPAVRAACRAALRDSAIRLVRIPAETAPPPARMKWETGAFARACREARRDFASSGWTAPPHFRGFDWSGTPSIERLEAILRALPEGDAELMVHPGAGIGPTGSFAGDDRRRETEALCDPRLPALLASLRIALWDGRGAP